MNVYDAFDEERIRTTKLLREWTKSGLLEKAQAQAIDPQLTTDLKRTNLALRIVLAVFGTFLMQAAFAFWILVLDARNEGAASVVAIVLGVVMIGAGEFLIARFRFYHFGIEEAVIFWASTAVIVGAGVLMARDGRWFFDFTPFLIAGVVGWAAGYVRYGYIYLAVLAIIAAALVPASFDGPVWVSRSIAAVLLLMVFVAARGARTTVVEEVRQDDFAIIEAISWVGAYLAIHLAPGLGLGIDDLWRDVPRWFYWGSYAAIWVLPPICLFIGLRERRRAMIDAGIGLSLVTLTTHKLYLGWPSHPWDPILLGVLLMGIAIGVRRWLGSGEEGERNGFTAKRILLSDEEKMSAVSMAAGAFRQGPTRPAPAAAPDTFTTGGGASGGAGASGKF